MRRSFLKKPEAFDVFLFEESGKEARCAKADDARHAEQCERVRSGMGQIGEDERFVWLQQLGLLLYGRNKFSLANTGARVSSIYCSEPPQGVNLNNGIPIATVLFVEQLRDGGEYQVSISDLLSTLCLQSSM